MTDFRHLSLAIGLAVVLAAIVLGSLIASMVEGEIQIALAPQTTLTQVLPPPPITLQPGRDLSTETDTALSAPTLVQVEPFPCPPPSGWTGYTVQLGDTLESIAKHFGASVELLYSGNCLIGATLYPGTNINIPHATPLTEITISNPTSGEFMQPIPTGPTPNACAPYRPSGWSTYQVRPGDNLYQIGISFGISWTELTRPNCIFNPNQILTGKLIYVPNVPTLTPFPTQPPLPTPPQGYPPTSTPTPVPPTQRLIPSITETNLPTDSLSANHSYLSKVMILHRSGIIFPDMLVSLDSRGSI